MQYLTRADLRAWTGARTRARVVEVIVRSAVPHIIGADGWPRVLRSVFEARMITGEQQSAPERVADRPAWSVNA